MYICIILYGSCYIDPMKHSTWVLTREWALAQDTMTVTCIHVRRGIAIILCSLQYTSSALLLVVWPFFYLKSLPLKLLEGEEGSHDARPLAG